MNFCYSFYLKKPKHTQDRMLKKNKIGHKQEEENLYGMNNEACRSLRNAVHLGTRFFFFFLGGGGGGGFYSFKDINALVDGSLSLKDTLKSDSNSVKLLVSFK